MFLTPFGFVAPVGDVSVSLTGLSTDSLGSYALVGGHASIGYTISPDNGTETVKWSNSSNPADAATFGTGASPTDYTSVDGASLYLHVTDGSALVTLSVAVRKLPATAAGGLGPYVFVTGAEITPVNLAADFTPNGNALSYAMVSALPAGLSVDSAGVMTGTPTVAVTTQSYTVRGTDEYGRTTDSAFNLATPNSAISINVEDDDTATFSSADGIVAITIENVTGIEHPEWALYDTGVGLGVYVFDTTDIADGPVFLYPGEIQGPLEEGGGLVLIAPPFFVLEGDVDTVIPSVSYSPGWQADTLGNGTFTSLSDTDEIYVITSSEIGDQIRFAYQVTDANGTRTGATPAVLVPSTAAWGLVDNGDGTFDITAAPTAPAALTLTDNGDGTFDVAA